MVQEIFTYLIVASAAGYSIYHIYLFFRRAGRKSVCACASCPVKDLKKQSNLSFKKSIPAGVPLQRHSSR
jgi:hypothetical protein